MAQTGDPQPEWARGRTIHTVASSHAGIHPDDVRDALATLVEEGRAEEDEGRYRPAEGVERVPHPGEIQ
ncbi:hypothetical protein [Haloarcula nitratireducens]|uniref:Uncharacterized protein n=1 Tax=Haloarcula nitratireducens TaxID=2487749 RepID=A0AAW4PIQ9_9EURY|nr:hypothetical protein [Halomicroarcula nitratireducens]MBX0298311.1 hypothetical protein [Halomicroarcula nitratireducens]